MKKVYDRAAPAGGFLTQLSSGKHPEYIAGAVAILGIVILVVLVCIH